MDSLTKYQHEVLELLLKGFDSTMIASKLHRSENRIKNVRNSLLEIFEAKTTIGMIVEAAKYGFLDSILKQSTKYSAWHKNDYLPMNEAVVLYSVLSGKTNSEISDELGHSRRRVNSYRSNIQRKWKIKSNVDLVVQSIKKRYLVLVPIALQLNINEHEKIWNLFQESIKADEKISYRRIYTTSLGFPPMSRRLLTVRQREILKMRIEGHNNKDISTILGIGVISVSNYFIAAKDRLNVSTVSEIVMKAISMNIVGHNEVEIEEKQTIDNKELTILLMLFESLNYKQIGEVLNKNPRMIAKMVNQRKIKWNVATVEGLLFEGLKRGEITWDMLIL